MFYADATGGAAGSVTPSALLGHGGSGAKLMQAAGAKGGAMAVGGSNGVAGPGAPGQRGSGLVPKGMGMGNGDHEHVVNALVGSPAGQQAAAGGTGAANGLVGGNLVMDAEGQLYTYGLGEAR